MSDARGTLVPGRSCDDCTLCCKLMGVPSLTKQIDAWCPHCKSKKSCAIYETRPQECRDFFCGYRTDRTLGDEWKPSVSKFIMVPAYQQNRVMVHVDPDRPEAWRQEPYYSTLMNLARKAAPHRGQVFIRIGAKTLLLTPQ